MNWYQYTHRRDGIGRDLIRPMTASQAERLGATLVPDFDPAQRVAGILVVTFPPDGQLEASFDSVLAEVPGGER